MTVGKSANVVSDETNERTLRGVPKRLWGNVRGLMTTADDELVDGGAPPETSLYTCEACQLTFIAKEMDTCHRCGDEVEEIPTADDLGYGLDLSRTE